MTRGQGALSVAILLLASLFAALNPAFATLANLSTLANQTAVLAVLAVGSTFAIISGNIDIAPASVGTLAAVVVALVLRGSGGIAVALLAGAVVTLAIYLLHGVLVARLRLDPLIVTLAGWIWARGLAVSLTNATTLPIRDGFTQALDTPTLFGLTPALGVVVVVYAGGWFVLNRTRLGICARALGEDERALAARGLDPGAWKIAVFGLMGVTTALAALLMIARLAAAAPTAGFGLELDAIVAVIIGGTSFTGGSGRIGNTVAGVVFIAVLDNGLSALQLGDAEFELLKGAGILAALLLDAASRRRRRAQNRGAQKSRA
jgi:ribose/xylose/arabinose/galactoside ABC-type transport system permease subunit